jgi:predicted O-methyltransferase YrrM
VSKSFLPDDLTEYVFRHSVQESDLLRRLREETLKTPEPFMQITPDQGKFLSLIVKMIQAVNTLEIGVFTGYSSLCVAQALPENGKIIACDVNKEWTTMARRYWREAGVEQKIDLRIAPAIETLQQLKTERRENSFDFVFIDADKENLTNYFELSLSLVRQFGVIAVDNTLRNGEVLNPNSSDTRVIATRQLNEKLISDERVDVCLLPTWDGLTLAVKK